MSELEQILNCFEQNFGRAKSTPIESDYATRKEFLIAKLEWKMSGGLRPPAKKSSLEMTPAKYNGEQLRKIYSWSNGELGSGYFKPTYSFLSIEQALEQNIEYKKMVEIQRTLPVAFLDFWPLFLTETRTDIGIFLSKSARKTSRIYSLSIWEGQIALLSSSIESYFKSIFRCQSLGVYSTGRISDSDPEEYLGEEEKLFREVHDEPIFPIVKKEGITVFHLDEKSFWPSQID